MPQNKDGNSSLFKVLKIKNQKITQKKIYQVCATLNSKISWTLKEPVQCNFFLKKKPQLIRDLFKVPFSHKWTNNITQLSRYTFTNISMHRKRSNFKIVHRYP